jgi:type III restriction enzyme
LKAGDRETFDNKKVVLQVTTDSGDTQACEQVDKELKGFLTEWADDVVIEFERAVTGEHATFKTELQHKTWSAEEVAEKMFQRLKSIDEESKDADDPKDRTAYAQKFPLAKCEAIVRESLRRARVKTGRVTDENRQKFLQALGTLRRKSAKRVLYRLSPKALVTLNTGERQAESCSAAELRRGTKRVFYPPGCEATLGDEQKEFFRELQDPDGDFASGREPVANAADFKTPANLVIADATPERKFVRELCNRDFASKVDAWLKNTPVGFYTIEYAWKKGEHPKRGEFSPDFFIKQGDWLFVVEIKDDSELSDPSAENVKKHEYATAHFDRLNKWLEKEKLPARYQFSMISPKDYGKFFTKLRKGELAGFRSDLDVAMHRAQSGR